MPLLALQNMLLNRDNRFVGPLVQHFRFYYSRLFHKDGVRSHFVPHFVIHFVAIRNGHRRSAPVPGGSRDRRPVGRLFAKMRYCSRVHIDAGQRPAVRLSSNHTFFYSNLVHYLL